MSESGPHLEPGGFTVPHTSDGQGVPVPLSEEAAAEIRRQSDEHDASIGQLLHDEATTLHELCQEILTTGSTTIREPNGNWTATLKRSRWRDGWLVSEGHRDGGSCSGRLRIPRRSSHDHVEASITLDLANALAWLREQ